MRIGAPVALAVLLGSCGPAVPDAGPSGESCVPSPPRPEGILAAGSGTTLPLARALAAAWRKEHGEPVVVAESIGTSGALRALRDGAIDVGLASRPLRPEESRGLREIPLAWTQHGVVVHRDTLAGTMPLDLLTALLAGDRDTLPDGTPAVVLLRETGDSGNRLLRDRLPELGRAIDEALASGRWPVCYTDQEMAAALQEVEGAVGFLDLGMIRALGLPLRMVRLVRSDGGEVPARSLLKPLSLVLGPGPDERAVRFAEAAGRRSPTWLWASGYVPPGFESGRPPLGAP